MDREGGGPLGQDQGRRLGAESGPCPTSSRKQGPVLRPGTELCHGLSAPVAALVSAGEPRAGARPCRTDCGPTGEADTWGWVLPPHLSLVAAVKYT